MLVCIQNNLKKNELEKRSYFNIDVFVESIQLMC